MINHKEDREMLKQKMDIEMSFIMNLMNKDLVGIEKILHPSGRFFIGKDFYKGLNKYKTLYFIDKKFHLIYKYDFFETIARYCFDEIHRNVYVIPFDFFYNINENNNKRGVGLVIEIRDNLIYKIYLTTRFRTNKEIKQNNLMFPAKSFEYNNLLIN